MRITRTKTIAPFALSLAALAQPAIAANFRSWVSGKGLDSNPCTQTLPCRTFQAAHDATLNGGEVNVLDPGDYGPLTINRAITIDGGDMAYIGAVPIGITINNQSAIVAIRNLSLVTNSIGYTKAIWVSAAQSLSAETVRIRRFTHGISVDDTGSAPPRVHVKSVTTHDTGYPIFTVGNVATDPNRRISLTVEGLTAYNATSGIAVSGTAANITRSFISTCVNNGVMGSSASEINLSDSTIVFANAGIQAGPGVKVRIAGNNIHNNTSALLTGAGGTIDSFGDNRIAGNGPGQSPHSTIPLQ